MRAALALRLPARIAPRERRRRRHWLVSAVTMLALLLALQALWLPAKAMLAQHLLHQAWQARLDDGQAHRPWPWADTHAVARLRHARLGIDQIVLAGDNGRVLAFGPGWAEASASPEHSHGGIVISGHRDTHFAWLRDLHAGDFVELQSRGGWRAYRALEFSVVDVRTQRLPLNPHGDVLQLVTCWPFDALTSGGPLRLVVTLQAVPALAAR